MENLKTKRVYDLTKPLGPVTEVYREGVYTDPPFASTEWCTVDSQGFKVFAISLGTQTGTHIDAPSHFVHDGPCLDALPVDQLMGRYFLLELPPQPSFEEIVERCRHYHDEGILFLRVKNSKVSTLRLDTLNALLKLPPLLWAISGEIEVQGTPSLEFHRLLARAGKFLIENLNSQVVQTVPKEGEMIALPLRLVGTSGAPCRVVVREVV